MQHLLAHCFQSASEYCTSTVYTTEKELRRRFVQSKARTLFVVAICRRHLTVRGGSWQHLLAYLIL